MSIRNLRQLAKRTWCHLLYWSGVLWLIKLVRCRDRAVVLTYHRVLSSASRARSWSHPGIIVSPEGFEQQLALLKRWFTVVAPNEFAARLRDGGRLESGTCLITFDDGWFDTYEEAWPLLRRHGVSAVIFVPTAVMGRSCPFWQEETARLLATVRRRLAAEPALTAQAREVLERYQLAGALEPTETDLRTALPEVVQRLKSRTPAQIQEAVSALRALAQHEDGDCADDRLMSWAQAREMHEGGIAFGGHGVTHSLLTNLPEADALQEIQRSRTTVEDVLSAEVAFFAYPNGSFSPAIARGVAAAGYNLAFTTEPGLVTARDDRYTLRRVNVHDGMSITGPMFLARILGVA